MTKNGLVVDGDGWFVLNARDSRWRSEGPLGSFCNFEGKRRFPQLGFNISVLARASRSGCTTARTRRKDSSSSPASAC